MNINLNFAASHACKTETTNAGVKYATVDNNNTTEITELLYLSKRQMFIFYCL